MRGHDSGPGLSLETSNISAGTSFIPGNFFVLRIGELIGHNVSATPPPKDRMAGEVVS